MALYKIEDFDPDYRNHFDNHDIKGADLYSGEEKIGSVDDILVDDAGQIRYLIVSTGVWILGKKVLFPIGRARMDLDNRKVYADHLTREQVETLPEFSNSMVLDYEHEERVRGIYRSGASSAAPMPNLDNEQAEHDQESYTYDREPDLYALNDQNHPNLKLYQERLVAGKSRQKAGEAVVSKRVETETAQASIPIEKERVVVERMPATSETAVSPGEATFQEGEVARMDVFEEVPEFRKEAFVREEVKVSKVVDQETATAEETLRREELDVDSQGNPNIDRKV